MGQIAQDSWIEILSFSLCRNFGLGGPIWLLESQALQYRIWSLGPSSRKLHKGKIWDFGTKLGLFWDHFYTLLGLLVVIFIKMPQNLQKAKKALKTVLSRRLMQRVF